MFVVFCRMLSLWEPFLEPWRCNVCWRHLKSKSDAGSGSWNFEMQASDRSVHVVNATLLKYLFTVSTSYSFSLLPS